MAKKIEGDTIKVVFFKEFDGMLNDFRIKVTKYDFVDKVTKRELPKPKRDLPLVVYEWIQKFDVCHDA